MDNVTTFPRRTFRMRRNLSRKNVLVQAQLRGAEPEDDRDDQQGTPQAVLGLCICTRCFVFLGLGYGH